MNDEKQQLLLEGLAADIAAIQKTLSNQNGGKEKTDDSKRLLEAFYRLREDVAGAIEGLKMVMPVKTSTSDQQRLINLKLQVDRVEAAVIRKGNWLRYYLSPPNVLVNTLVIIFFSFMFGAIADRIYYNFQHDKNLNIQEDGTN